ncbi:2-methylaconitate cis-trans isomerase PrpF family protein [Paenalcaligenes hominis]|uniref:2-methylaconitate cis-trans isomerase PrpF family protein n=1 Tax=Paenalcaligenes hominis TaxID=643674 RepID=UPI003526B217
MSQISIDAVFMRGGTSKALMIQPKSLPSQREEWDPLFCAAMGTPDPYGRQLNGMGGGISSLSKVCIVGPSSHPDADVDYTFGQVAIKEHKVSYQGNCGNMSSAVGPFAIDQGLVAAQGDTTTVRIYNTNTKKIIHSTFATPNGQTQYAGELSIPGVGGTGSPIKLEFIEPGGATTGQLLPTGQVKNTLSIPELGDLEVSMVDAANAAVFVRAADIGLTGLELPDELEQQPEVLAKLELIRIHASVAMGITPDLETAKTVTLVPFVAFVSAPQDNPTLSGELIPASAIDLVARVISSGQPHRALPLTVSLCTAVAARITGTVVADLLRPEVRPDAALRLGMPSGVLTVDAAVHQDHGYWHAHSGAFYRTANRLFEGRVWINKDDIKPCSHL